jgi:hypothetical protein
MKIPRGLINSIAVCLFTIEGVAIGFNYNIHHNVSNEEGKIYSISRMTGAHSYESMSVNPIEVEIKKGNIWTGFRRISDISKDYIRKPDGLVDEIQIFKNRGQKYTLRRERDYESYSAEFDKADKELLSTRRRLENHPALLEAKSYVVYHN